MPALLTRVACLLCATLMSAVLAAPASATDAPFTTRFAQTARGDIAAVGNTLMTCPGSCSAAQNGTTANDNDFTMGYVDVDGDGSTASSSRATVSLPVGTTVLWAGLYWSADTSAGTNGVAAPAAASMGTIKLRVPNGASYQSITAAPADVLTSSLQATRYRAFKNVTSLVAAAGAGTYSVADIQAGTGQDRFAGWSLIVAYRDSAQPIRRLNVYDGLGTVDGTHTFSTTIAPFHTPATGTVTTKAGLLTFEGDAGLANETVKFNGHDLTDPLNPANNAMNSTIESGGTPFTAKAPDYANQLGMDLDVFTNNPGALVNDQNTAVLAFTSSSEYFMPSTFFLVSDEGPATVTGAPSVGGTAADGTTLTADPGSWNGTGPLTYTYQWERCDASGANCHDINGATQSSYTPGAADIGSTIRVVVTASNDAGSSTPVTSAATAVTVPSPPASTTVPALPGTATKGQALTANTGSWSGTGPMTYAYQWQRCDASGANCHDIAGATNSTYTPGADDVGSTVRVVVTATNVAGTNSVASAPTSVAAPSRPVNTSAPVLSGPAAQGQALTAGHGSWSSPGSTYTYQWQRCDASGAHCADIKGATDSSYTPGADDVGHTLRAVVTATNDAGSATTITTTSAVVAASDLGSVPGSLVGATGCQQLVGGAKYRRVALAGIGTVRVRAYTNGPARESSPVRLTTEVTGGRAKSVRYTIDGRSVAARAGALHRAKLTPGQLGKVGEHTLRTAVRGRHGAARTVVLQLTTAPCQTLFTAQRWRTTAGAGLRLRIDSRTALTGLTFKVPAALLPKQGAAKRSAGFLRLSLAGRRKPVRFNLSLPKRGQKAVLLRAPGRPTVTRTGRGLVVAGLPAGTAVTELTLYRITKLDAATPRRTYGIGAVVARSGAPAQTFSARPAQPR
jgi:hypothetical protein